MKHRVLDVMNEALGLVKKSDLGGATALIRKALSGEAAPRSGDLDAPAHRPPAKVIPLAPRRPLGETLRALRLRPIMPPSAPEAPEPGPAPDLGERFLKRTYSGPAGSLDYRLYVPADHEQRELALIVMLHGCTQRLGGFRSWHEDERACRGIRPHRRLSAPAAPRQSQRLLELVRPAPPEPGLGRTGEARGPGAGAREGVRRPTRARFRGGPVGRRRDGGDSGRNLSGCVRRGRDTLRSALQVSRRRPLRFRRDEGKCGVSSRAPRRERPAKQSASGRHVRKIIVHGLADSTVSAINGEHIFDEVEGETSLARSALDWPIEGGRVSCAAVKAADGRPVAEQWLVEGGGHAWFGGDKRGSFTQSVGLDASRVIVRFFLAE